MISYETYEKFICSYNCSDSYVSFSLVYRMHAVINIL